MFEMYLKLGFDHILDLQAYDHILFVLTLNAVYSVKEWKKVLILVTAFTIGHSLTLALSVLKIVTIPVDLIETLIPITIILTALYNLFYREKESSSSRILYGLALFFGLIHGLGFSNYLNALLGSEESILIPLLGFNIGVEFGQLIVVAIGLLLSYILLEVVGLKAKYWNNFISILAIIVSIYLLVK
jgi:hypothetical protein